MARPRKAAAAADHARLAERLAKQIYPLLAGHPPQVQGAVIGDLAAMWLAGFAPRDRDEILRDWLELVRELVPEQVRVIAADGLFK